MIIVRKIVLVLMSFLLIAGSVSVLAETREEKRQRLRNRVEVLNMILQEIKYTATYLVKYKELGKDDVRPTLKQGDRDHLVLMSGYWSDDFGVFLKSLAGMPPWKIFKACLRQATVNLGEMRDYLAMEPEHLDKNYRKVKRLVHKHTDLLTVMKMITSKYLVRGYDEK